MIDLYAHDSQPQAGVLWAADPFSPPDPSPTPTPTPDAPVLSGGGGPWSDRDEDDTDFLRDVERIQGGGEVLPLVETWSFELVVEVRATFLEVDVIERGNLIYFVAHFEGDPDEVHFAYIRPGEKRPIVDPGYGLFESCIVRQESGVYTTVIDTTGFGGGELTWHFWGTGNHQASEFGRVKVNARPAQLL